MTARIETGRLLLRQPTPDDLAGYRAVEGEDDAARELFDAVAHWRAHGFGPWLVEEAGQPVAVLEIHFAGPGVTGIRPDEVEIGWAVAEAARGRGIATEAARAAASDAFERIQPAPDWIVAYIRPENGISMRVAERIGMRRYADGLTRSGDPMGIYRLDRTRVGNGQVSGSPSARPI
jgi:RimJ/RimL family protein N-acetyltransferase